MREALVLGQYGFVKASVFGPILINKAKKLDHVNLVCQRPLEESVINIELTNRPVQLTSRPRKMRIVVDLMT